MAKRRVIRLTRRTSTSALTAIPQRSLELAQCGQRDAATNRFKFLHLLRHPREEGAREAV
jgi:hypothetical protein